MQGFENQRDQRKFQDSNIEEQESSIEMPTLMTERVNVSRND